MGGQGTPWGPRSYGTANSPNLYTDPTQFADPGIKAQVQQVRTNAGALQGKGNNAALAALQRAGVAGGSEAGNALGSIAGQTAEGADEALAKLQSQESGQETSLMDALNSAMLSKYQTESGNDLGENSQRQNMLSGAGNLLGTLFGYGIGSKNNKKTP